MKFNFLKRQKPVADSAARPGQVYTSVDQLTRLQAHALGFSFLPSQPVGSLLAGRHASRLRGRGLNFDEIRHYVPGDDVRNMDWKVTARMRKPHVRVYTEERDRPVLLLVDQRRSMFFGSQRSMKSVAAAEVAALAAWRVLASGDRIGSLLFNDQVVEEITPQRSRNRVMWMLGRLADMNQQLSGDSPVSREPGMLNRALDHAARIIKHDALVVVITDGDGVDEKTLQLASRIQSRNDLIWVRVFDRLERGLPDLGQVFLGDGNSEIELDTSNRHLMRRFSEQFGEQMRWARNKALRAEVPWLAIDAAAEVLPQLRRSLGAQAGGKVNAL
jgi:uncharacterized protein (DUF58 family)